MPSDERKPLVGYNNTDTCTLAAQGRNFKRFTQVTIIFYEWLIFPPPQKLVPQLIPIPICFSNESIPHQLFKICLLCCALCFAEVNESLTPYGSTDDNNGLSTSATTNGAPMVTCRVCQALIDISGKRDQHVVKCGQCEEATVWSIITFSLFSAMFNFTMQI